jgi:hypothetical protein
MKADRLFYVATSVLFLALMALGFHLFVPHGVAAGGRIIAPTIFPIVAVHGLAIAAWYVLFFLQATLIAVRNRKLHMTLGWSVVVIAPLIAIMGTVVAVRSVQVTPPVVQFFGLPYSRFLLLMLTEMAVFSGFVIAGVVTRKKPRIHRAMMLCASLTLLSGATARIPLVDSIFGETGFFGLFRPVLVIAIVLLLVRWLQTRTFDRALATGCTILFGVFAVAYALAPTSAWDAMAAAILKL